MTVTVKYKKDPSNDLEKTNFSEVFENINSLDKEDHYLVLYRDIDKVEIIISLYNVYRVKINK